MERRTRLDGPQRSIFVLAIATAPLMAACGGSAVTSGAAVGRVGQELASHAQNVPQGGEVCALKEAAAAQAGAADKPMAESCGKQMANDALWRRSMIVLAAYGETLDTIASGNQSEATGKLEAAQTGVHGKDWIQVEGPAEQGARDAAAQLVEQMNTSAGKDDLEKTIKDAAPHVNVLCGGLTGYIDEQTRALDEVQKDLEKKRAAHTDRRCTTLDGKSVCVGDSASDRVVYAHAAAQLALLETHHMDARDAVNGFCTAHKKLEEAAANGNVSKDETYASVVDAVKASRRAPPASEAKPAAAKPAAPPEPAASKQ